MIQVKQAALRAAEFLSDILSGEGIQDIRLEEVEWSAEGELWYVTLSFLRPPAKGPTGLFEPKRDYRVVAVYAVDGDVKSMKIRELTTRDTA